MLLTFSVYSKNSTTLPKSVQVLGFLLSLIITACSSQPDIPYKGQYLDNLDQAANFISAKNTAKKLIQNKIYFDEKAFALGAYDYRDDLDSRLADESFDDLLAQAKAKAPTIGNLVQSSQVTQINENTSDLNNYPEGLNTPEKRLSYLSARSLAKAFSKQGIEIVPESMLAGLADARSKAEPILTEKEEKILLNAIKAKLSSNSNEWAARQRAYYQKEEKKFFALNITQKGVVALDSGVQYKIIEKGMGQAPTIKDEIKLYYRGSLLDGTEFDSSYARNKPDTFKLKAMIPGFIEGMQQIQEGSKAMIYIPAKLAYKERGTQGIPPNAAVIFEVELLKINP